MTQWKEKRKIMQRYDLTARMYDERYAEEQEAKFERALGTVKIPPNGLVLDIGCGTGLLFKHLSSATEGIVGIDLSKKALFEARDRPGRLRNVDLLQADADYLPFRDHTFRLVFVFTVLQNMPQPIETLREAKRITRHHGSVVASGLKKAFTLESFKEMIQKAGLKPILTEDDDVLKCYVAVCLKNRSQS
jgi:ubiquinone/menaquinone biosynthesis C-methylase UbiE